MGTRRELEQEGTIVSTKLLSLVVAIAGLAAVGAGPAAAASQSEGNCLGTAYSYTQSNGNGERTSSQATAEPGLGQVVSSFVYQAGTFLGPLASSPECRS
jgi:hypothetical protein